MFGKVAGEAAADYARSALHPVKDLTAPAQAAAGALRAMLNRREGERLALLRDTMRDSMEEGVGIYRSEAGIRATCAALAQLRSRYARGVRLDDTSRAFNTEWLTAIELGFMLEVAEAMAHCALHREESRGAHMRLDFEHRDDVRFLKHSLAYYGRDGAPRIEHRPVTITQSPPKARHYGGAGRQALMT